DRPPAERRARRRRVLGLHRSQGRPHRPQPGRGGGARGAAHGARDPAVPAVLDEGTPAASARARARVPRVPARVGAARKADAVRRHPRMSVAPVLSIVLPVFNEADSITPVLRGLVASVRTPHEILVVYDFDEDTTVPVVRGLAAELPRVRLHRNTRGRGVLNAMRAGIEASRGELVLISMADGSDEPEVVDRMVALANGGADVVAASRYM